jgi:hypothetical protein
LVGFGIAHLFMAAVAAEAFDLVSQQAIRWSAEAG